MRDDLDGIAEDIIPLLSKSRALLVIARNSSFTYKGRVADIKQNLARFDVIPVLPPCERTSTDTDLRKTSSAADVVSAAQAAVVEPHGPTFASHSAGSNQVQDGLVTSISRGR